MSVYQRIMELIDLKRTNIHQVERELGLPISSISKWKDGKINPSADSLVKLALHFGVSTDYLLGLDGLALKTAKRQDPETKAIVESFGKLEKENQQKLLTYLQSLLQSQPE